MTISNYTYRFFLSFVQHFHSHAVRMASSILGFSLSSFFANVTFEGEPTIASDQPRILVEVRCYVIRLGATPRITCYPNYHYYYAQRLGIRR